MKNWGKKTRGRENVAFILPGSTMAFKKCRHVNVMGQACILAPRSGKAKNAGAFAIPLICAITTRQAAEQRHDTLPR
jgi:hypothetical protein